MLTLQTQIAFFFKEIYNQPLEKISIKIKETFGEAENTTQLPLDRSVPPEVPRITINFKGFIINISLSRIDLVIHNTHLYKELTDKFLQYDFESFGIDIIRIGFVRTYFDEKDKNELRELLSVELKSKDYKEINIRFNLPFSFNEYECNSIEKIDVGGITQKDKKGNTINKNGIIIQKDINTVNEKKDTISLDKRIEFVKEFEKKIDKFYAYNAG